MASEMVLNEKKERIQELASIFESNGVYLFDYRGLSVNEMETLRNTVKELDGNVQVIKNRLAIKYFEGKGLEHGRELFNGPMAVVYSGEKFVEVAKALVEFEKESKKIAIKSGFIETNFVEKEQIVAVSKLPGREQLMGQFAFSVAMPLKKWGMALSAPLTNMLVLLKNLKDKKEEEGEK